MMSSTLLFSYVAISVLLRGLGLRKEIFQSYCSYSNCYFSRKQLHPKRTNSEKFGVTLSHVNPFFAIECAACLIIPATQ